MTTVKQTWDRNPNPYTHMERHGVYFRGEGAEGLVPPFTVNAVNSVGAGDCFNGGLAVALAAMKNFLQPCALRQHPVR